MKLKYKYLLLYTFLLFSFGLKGQQVLQIFLRQNQLSQYQLEIEKKNQDSIALYSQLTNFKLDYLSESYFLAGYDSIVFDSLYCYAYFTSFDKYEFGQIVFAQPQEYTNEYFRLFEGKTISDYSFIKETIYNMLNDAANNGYPFAQFVFDSVKIDINNNIILEANLDLGEKYYFDSLHIKSDSKIRQHYLEEYLDIKSGDVFSIKKTENINSKINKIKYLEFKRPFQLAFGENNVDLLLYLKKKKANNFNGMIGILPNNKTTGKLLITGDVNLLLLNSFGAGELFSFNWQKFEASSQNLNTEFSIPYLFKTKFGLGALFDIEKKDSTYLNTEFTGKILFGSNTANGFEMFFNRTASYIISQDATAGGGFKDFKVNLFGGAYRFSYLDNYLAPRKGISLKINTSFGTKTTDEIDSDKALLQNKTRFEISYYIPILKYMTIKFRNLNSMIYSSQIFENELDLIGGLKTIRGFDELSLPVTSYSVINTELRYVFEQTSAFFLFYDIAYFEKRYTLSDSYNYGMGIGAGLDLNTNAGIFSIVFAIGKQNDNSFLFNASKIHFGYKSMF